eukprot:3338686-Rhodomonas_salina.2
MILPRLSRKVGGAWHRPQNFTETAGVTCPLQHYGHCRGRSQQDPVTVSAHSNPTHVTPEAEHAPTEYSMKASFLLIFDNKIDSGIGFCAA